MQYIFCFVINFIKILVPLHKISCTSAIQSKLYCIRFALSLHKTSCTSAIQSKLYCIRFALPLQQLYTKEYEYKKMRLRDDRYCAPFIMLTKSCH